MKKSKKIISLLLSVLMIITSISLMAVNSFAANSDFVINNYNGTVTVQKYTGSASYVSIPSGVTDISEFAFSGCNTVETVYIPQSVAKIGFARLVSNAFSGCLSLKEIIVADDNAYYSSRNGVLFNKDKTTLYYYPAAKSDYSYTVPQSVTAIRSHAFGEAKRLVEVNITSNVNEIDDGIFDSCSSLKRVTLSSGCTSITPYMFRNCTSLESITIPNTVTDIYYEAFRGCTSLKSIVIPNSVKKVPYYCFVNCPSLEFVYVPASVTEIEEGAFGYREYDNKLSNFTIYGIKGTAAEEYANSNGFTFVERLFPDVASNDWYFNAVKFNAEKGYVTGYSNGTFGPSNNIQRQDFVLILARIAGADLSAYEGQNGGFSDVQAGAYYASAVAWAKDTGVANGFSADNFGVGTYISREQICIMLCRYLNGSVSGDADTILNAYSDGGNTSPWAKAGVAWAVENGIIGNSDYLNPNGNAGRAEVAQIIYNMSNKGML